MRVGLVGVGRFGRRYLQTLASLEHFELVAVASRNAATPALLPAACVLHADWRDLLEHGGLDGLLVVTPPRSHADIVSAAVHRGLAVLVEKPLTLDEAEAEKLLALRLKAPVMVEHTHLFAPAYAALRERVAAGVQRIEVQAGGTGPLRADVPVLWDWGAHWVAVCLDLLGRSPRHGRCTQVERRLVHEGAPAGESIVVELDFAPVQAVLRLSNLLPGPCRRLSVQTGDDTLVYDELAASALMLTSPDGSTRAVPVDDERPLRAALRAFHDAWRQWQAGESVQPRSGLALGAEVVRVLARCESNTHRR